MNSKKKILIITYYWPPAGGSGVQRWLKFVKYLPQFGWTPVVITPELTGVMAKDESLMKDIPAGIQVIRRPIWEPYELFQNLSKLTGGKEMKSADFISSAKPSLFGRLSRWIRANYFIPDPRVYWVKPTITYLTKFLADNDIRTVVTTGPPHSMHLIGLGLKRRHPALQWIADFRDPWSEWDILDALPMSGSSRRKHASLERAVLTTADKVITIAPYHVARLEALSGRNVELVTNGFDEDDFKGIVKAQTSKFTICHVGVVDELRDPRPFLKALEELIIANKEFGERVDVKFIGNVNSVFQNDVLSNPAIRGIIAFIEPLPHSQLLQQYGATDVQLLVLAHTAIAPGNLPGKFFEYLASGNSILAIGPVNGDAAAILDHARAGAIYDRTDIAGIKAFLIDHFGRWKSGDRSVSGGIEQYSRRKLTQRLVEVIDRGVQSPTSKV